METVRGGQVDSWKAFIFKSGPLLCALEPGVLVCFGEVGIGYFFFERIIDHVLYDCPSWIDETCAE